MDGLRRSHYLDGPNDVDWIFRNEIEAQREERLYVDYVETDDGDLWVTPARFDEGGWRSHRSGAVELVGALSRAGFLDARALAVVAGVWRGFSPVPETHWTQNQERTRSTLEKLPVEIADIDVTEGDYSRILTQWTFPLHGTDVSVIAEDLDSLREIQRQWDPDGNFDYV